MTCTSRIASLAHRACLTFPTPLPLSSGAAVNVMPALILPVSRCVAIRRSISSVSASFGNSMRVDGPSSACAATTGAVWCDAVLCDVVDVVVLLCFGALSRRRVVANVLDAPETRRLFDLCDADRFVGVFSLAVVAVAVAVVLRTVPPIDRRTPDPNPTRDAPEDVRRSPPMEVRFSPTLVRLSREVRDFFYTTYMCNIQA